MMNISMVWCGTVWFSVVWYGMVWAGVVWYGVVWGAMGWYGVVSGKTGFVFKLTRNAISTGQSFRVYSQSQVQVCEALVWWYSVV